MPVRFLRYPRWSLRPLALSLASWSLWVASAGASVPVPVRAAVGQHSTAQLRQLRVQTVQKNESGRALGALSWSRHVISKIFLTAGMLNEAPNVSNRTASHGGTPSTPVRRETQERPHPAGRRFPSRPPSMYMHLATHRILPEKQKCPHLHHSCRM